MTASADRNPFHSVEAALRFERRVLAAIRHATRYGLFTALEASSMAERVRALTAEKIALLRAHSDDVLVANASRH
ncbi:hypothetical protein Amsp01_088100 [Amycolatopsis sp. NBRC 101858]|uniref:hypothetical protein n=1 Tax=Amycolatopsis sp. NBRC 101858 TaxID=3032200 RepID=UPI0024A5E39A|nr:hypothetical protein [Amycolatopsis sp. NBRC 101858]GLY42787.1 hypothetical protein Amsp01_088100 [Amycolatopsis sp. NBRC 101858]